MPKPWELDWSAAAPAPDATPLPIVPFFGRPRAPMLGNGGVEIDMAEIPSAYGVASADPLATQAAGSPPVAAADPLAMQAANPSSALAATAFETPAAAPAQALATDAPPFQPPVPSAGAVGDQFAQMQQPFGTAGLTMVDPAAAVGAARMPLLQPAVYGAWNEFAGQTRTPSAPGEAEAAPATLTLAQVLRTNGFPDAPPRPVPPSQVPGGPPRSPERYNASQPGDVLRTYGLGAIPPPEPRNAPQRRMPGQRPAPNPFSPENLSLGPNAQYRNDIVAASQHGPLTPEGLAAILGGEASSGPRGRWDPKSTTGQSEARGLGQITPDQWEQDARRPGSYLNGVARSLGWLDRRGNIDQAHRQEFLNLRFDPRHSIYATADLARHNLAVLDRAHLILDRSPAALAQYAYIAHHEGLTGAINVLRGTRRIIERIWTRNVPRAERQGWLAANGNNRDRAYLAWLAHYAAERVDPRNYMNDSRNVTIPTPESLYPRPQSR